VHENSAAFLYAKHMMDRLVWGDTGIYGEPVSPNLFAVLPSARALRSRAKLQQFLAWDCCQSDAANLNFDTCRSIQLVAGVIFG
jgi:hypothetical protein